MASVELSEATYRKLLRRSTSFDDTPEDVINRLLDVVGDRDPLRRQEIKEAVHKNRPRAKPGSILPERDYWKPILEVIVEGGGSVPANDVVERVGDRLRNALKPRDFEQLATGEVRWRNRVRFARLRMRQVGLLSDTSHRGLWEITDSGRAYMEAA
jgi:hypothetical protein